METKSKLLNAEEAAKFLNTTKGTIYFWVNQKKIPHVRMNAALRFDIEDLEKWLKKNKVEARVVA